MQNNSLDVTCLLETVKQAKSFLIECTSEHYEMVAAPHFSSSAGAHMRHILDHYLALKEGLCVGVVNYNKRNRHASFESCPKAALNVWQDIEEWLSTIDLQQADKPLVVICETSVYQTQNTQTDSTLARELVFVSSHAIHHFSLLTVMSSILGIQTESQFGIAPSTASYIRQQA